MATMRDLMTIVESAVLGHINSRFAPEGTPDTPVINVSTRSHLDALLAKHHSMRAMYEGDFLAMWDGRWATHRNYEDQLGGDGWRIDISLGSDACFVVGFNIHDCTPIKLKRSELFRELFSKEELNSMTFVANEV